MNFNRSRKFLRMSFFFFGNLSNTTRDHRLNFARNLVRAIWGMKSGDFVAFSGAYYSARSRFENYTSQYISTGDCGNWWC